MHINNGKWTVHILELLTAYVTLHKFLTHIKQTGKSYN
jgi:hypothetical protein